MLFRRSNRDEFLHSGADLLNTNIIGGVPFFLHLVLKYLGLHICCCLHRLYKLPNVLSNVGRSFSSPIYPDWMKGFGSLDKAAWT